MQVACAPRTRGLPVCSKGVQVNGRARVVRVQAQRNNADPSPDILTAFFYGRALAITLNRRLSEAAIDFVSDVSKALAERPQIIAEIQEEVLALARKDMSASGFQPQITATSGATAAGAAATSGSGTAALQDPQAAIDDLRAEIAYARASLNEIRAAQKATAPLN